MSGGTSMTSLSQTNGNPEFVAVDDKYKCIVCLGILHDPMQTTCGHRICADPCVANVFGKNASAQCPAKEEECGIIQKAELNPDFSARREIRLLPVYCTYKSEGCSKMIPWKDLEAHAVTCPFEPVTCPNKLDGCDSVLTKATIDFHLESCPYKLDDCHVCGEKVVSIHLAKHLETSCPNVMVSCPYRCGGGKMTRRQLEDHKNVCLHKPKECRFKPAGCNFQGSEADVLKHEKESVEEHLGLVTIYTASFDLSNMQMRQRMQEMVNERDRLNALLEEKDTEIKELKKSVTLSNGAIKDLRMKIVSLTERIITLERAQEDGKKDTEKLGQEAVSLKQSVCSLRDRVTQLETGVHQGGSLGQLSDAVMTQITSHDRQIGLHDVRLAEMDIHFQVLENMSSNGTLLWKLQEYQRLKAEAVNGRSVSLYSQPFRAGQHSYKMCARVYLNGDGIGKGTHMSLFFVIMRGDYDALLKWPFRQNVTLMVLDQENGSRNLCDSFRPDPSSSSFRRPTSEMNIASGCPRFVAHETLEQSPYLKDDAIFIKVIVDTSSLSTL